MAYSQDGNVIAGKADADWSVEGTGQYRAVVRTATGFALAGVNTATFAGILQNAPALGFPATVKTQETSKAVAGGAFARGAKLTTDANGRLVLAALGQRVVAEAEAPAAASGDVVAVRVLAGLGLAP